MLLVDGVSSFVLSIIQSIFSVLRHELWYSKMRLIFDLHNYAFFQLRGAVN